MKKKLLIVVAQTYTIQSFRKMHSSRKSVKSSIINKNIFKNSEHLSSFIFINTHFQLKPVHC